MFYTYSHNSVSLLNLIYVKKFPVLFLELINKNVFNMYNDTSIFRIVYLVFIIFSLNFFLASCLILKTNGSFRHVFILLESFFNRIESLLVL